MVISFLQYRSYQSGMNFKLCLNVSTSSQIVLSTWHPCTLVQHLGEKIQRNKERNSWLNNGRQIIVIRKSCYMWLYSSARAVVFISIDIVLGSTFCIIFLIYQLSCKLCSVGEFSVHDYLLHDIEKTIHFTVWQFVKP